MITRLKTTFQMTIVVSNANLITVGKISEVTKKPIENVAEIPNFPTKANAIPTV